jgi:type IV secretion system protein VirB8
VKAEPALEAYFAEAASWDADRAAQAGRRARVAWAVAAAGWSCAIAASLAVAMLVPTYRVEPYLIRVGETSGRVEVVPLYTGTEPLPEAVTRFLLNHYVTVCERFVYATAESDYAECGAFHSAARNQAWYAAWATTNPDSPLNRYRDGTTVRAEVSAISFFERAAGQRDLAQIRYLKATRPAGGEARRAYYVATVQFAYGEPPADPAVRRWNPLGFRVLEFRAEPEAVAPAAPSVASDARGRP